MDIIEAIIKKNNTYYAIGVDNNMVCYVETTNDISNVNNNIDELAMYKHYTSASFNLITNKFCNINVNNVTTTVSSYGGKLVTDDEYFIFSKDVPIVDITDLGNYVYTIQTGHVRDPEEFEVTTILKQEDLLVSIKLPTKTFKLFKLTEECELVWSSVC